MGAGSHEAGWDGLKRASVRIYVQRYIKGCSTSDAGAFPWCLAAIAVACCAMRACVYVICVSWDLSALEKFWLFWRSGLSALARGPFRQASRECWLV
jgi:hypothetical protein